MKRPESTVNPEIKKKKIWGKSDGRVKNRADQIASTVPQGLGFGLTLVLPVIKFNNSIYIYWLVTSLYNLPWVTIYPVYFHSTVFTLTSNYEHLSPVSFKSCGISNPRIPKPPLSPHNSRSIFTPREHLLEPLLPQHGLPLVAQTVKSLPTLWEIGVRSLGWEDPLEKEMATHSSILAWKIPWTEELGWLLSMGSRSVGRGWATSLPLSLFPSITDYSVSLNHEIMPYVFIYTVCLTLSLL